jgi:hypothetical protein
MSLNLHDVVLENINNVLFSLLPSVLGFIIFFSSLMFLFRLLKILLLRGEARHSKPSISPRTSSKVNLSKGYKKTHKKGNRASHTIREVGERRTTSNDDDSLLPLITTLAVTSAILSSDDDNSNDSSYDSSSDYDSSSSYESSSSYDYSSSSSSYDSFF